MNLKAILLVSSAVLAGVSCGPPPADTGAFGAVIPISSSDVSGANGDSAAAGAGGGKGGPHLVCGDKLVTGNETCDDGYPSFNGDGCDSICLVEAGWECPGNHCQDIDECTSDTDNCGINAVCTNTPGSFSCSCPDQYFGDILALCSPWTVCTGGQYETSAPTSTSDRVCADLTDCIAGQFVSSPPTTTEDRQCQSCDAGTYSDSTNLLDCSNCNAGTYSSTIGATSAATCINCDPGAYSSTVGATSSDTCSAWTVCTDDQYESTAPTANSDRICKDFLQARVNYTTGTNPWGVTLADLNADNVKDLAVVNNGANTVSVFQGNSNGTFQPKVDYAAHSGPIGAVAVDLDGDGKIDLAVTNFNSNTVSIFRNTSTSSTISFATQVEYSTPGGADRIAAGDFDGDGKIDIAETNKSGNSVSVFRNTSISGTISFAARQDFSTGTSGSNGAVGIVLGDFDGDGKLDLAVTNKTLSQVLVFRNTSSTGAISFAAKVPFSASINPDSLVVGDFDGDTKLDLAVTNFGSNTISVFRNTSPTGSITFASKVDLTTGTNPAGIVAADFDGDSKLDLIVANQNSNTFSVFRNSGSSGVIGFETRTNYTTGANPIAIVAGDINGDGRVDLLVTENGASSVSVFLSNAP